VRELRPGLWHWEAPHPGWAEGEPWNRNVSSYAIDDGERLLLFDPLGVPVYTPRPDTAEDLLRMFDFTAPAGWVSDDVRWLVDGEGEAHWYSAGARLPVGVQAFPGHKRNDLVLWVESHRAVVAGDTLADLGEGPQINPRWLVKGATREHVADGLLPLLTLPVEHLLATHGGPFDRAGLERALS
jgi:glyoxylase-like metal-dependent hydrolase (beta-lactamase superfamily II)